MVRILQQLSQIDAFSKTLEDFRIRTTGGGTVTLVALLVSFLLVISEWQAYRHVSTVSEVRVDKERLAMIDIQMNITFPKVPCHLLTLDMVNANGEIANDVRDQVRKIRLDSDGRAKGSHQAAAGTSVSRTSGCGSCYNARDQTPENGVCCNTCQDVQDAYNERGWTVDPHKIEQCQGEAVIRDEEEAGHEGCRFEGKVFARKTSGNFHFAPGKSFQQMGQHVHDLGGANPMLMDFSHHIHQLDIGVPFPGRQSPLADVRRDVGSPGHLYQYFMKIVPTKYYQLASPLDALHSYQYSVTQYERHLTDMLHAMGAHIAPDRLPAAFFTYDIGSLLVIYREKKPSFWYFMVSVFAIIGGVITIAGLFDKAIYNAEQAVRKKTEIGKQS